MGHINLLRGPGPKSNILTPYTEHTADYTCQIYYLSGDGDINPVLEPKASQGCFQPEEWSEPGFMFSTHCIHLIQLHFMEANLHEIHTINDMITLNLPLLGFETGCVCVMAGGQSHFK